MSWVIVIILQFSIFRKTMIDHWSHWNMCHLNIAAWDHRRMAQVPWSQGCQWIHDIVKFLCDVGDVLELRLNHFSLHLCVGFLFLLVHSRPLLLPPPASSCLPPPPSLTTLSHATYSHTHTTYKQLPHTHTTLTHTTYSHISLTHTHNLQTHVHTNVTHTQLTHNLLTHNSHTPLTHT